jgi:hypothetical protein
VCYVLNHRRLYHGFHLKATAQSSYAGSAFDNKLNFWVGGGGGGGENISAHGMTTEASGPILIYTELYPAAKDHLKNSFQWTYRGTIPD